MLDRDKALFSFGSVYALLLSLKLAVSLTLSEGGGSVETHFPQPSVFSPKEFPSRRPFVTDPAVSQLTLHIAM